ncbi:TlpA family protein disulfide reductase [Peptacetobacter sp.]|uniref:TlpA family protein disulfide reductase n=1 Tax=Peptacetobacter sp. TaxID=2991975 RepID=UPI00261B90A5|nr:TlpA disulfide reductase family protein [Peptacetobacter sp.]
MKKKNLFIVFVVTIISSILLVGCGQNTSEVKILQKGDEAPNFTAELNNGKTFELANNKGKKITILNFWATWCGPCVEELPAMEKLQKDYGDKIEVMAINSGDSKDLIGKFLKANKYTLPIAYDENLDISRKYPTDGIPYTLIIDKDGKVYEVYTGSSGAEAQYMLISEKIEEILNK